MKKNNIPLTSFRLQNFKAVRDSRTIRFTPLTALIGNNGSGKSSIVEALETFQILATQGIDVAMQPWHGYEHILNKATNPMVRHIINRTGPMAFTLRGASEKERFNAHVEISSDSDFDKVFFRKYKRSSSSDKLPEHPEQISDGKITDPALKSFVKDWQIFRLVPQLMAEPVPQKRTYGAIRPDKTGMNIAEYLQSVRDKDVHAFNGIVETLKVVLPCTLDLQPVVTSELDRKVYLSLSEENISGRLPGWLLSTGTLRILALITALRHPDPSRLIIVEEVENGLDPRTIHLLIDEFRHFVESGRGQVILTTHSPYLLDLLSLSHIIVVERDESGSPQFVRPASQKTLKQWGERFAPGKLYTMGRLTRSC